MQPWPKASTVLNAGETTLRCILIDVEPLGELASAPPGTVLKSGSRLLVMTGSGVLQIHRIQPQGKQAMDATAFTNGYRVTLDSQFE